jgi:hypothetical protein
MAEVDGVPNMGRVAEAAILAAFVPEQVQLGSSGWFGCSVFSG